MSWLMLSHVAEHAGMLGVWGQGVHHVGMLLPGAGPKLVCAASSRLNKTPPHMHACVAGVHAA